MADIAASDVTVTVQDRTIAGKPARRRHRVSIAFGDGALTYPANGIPLPNATKFGMARSVDRLSLIDAANADGLMYKVDHANKKIRIYFPTQQTAGAGNRAGVELTGGSSVVAATTLVADAEGW